MTVALRLDKSFSYRGSAEKWSGKYHLTGGTPGSTAEWTAICDALVAAEKAVYGAGTTVVYAAGYLSDTGAATFTRDYTVSPDTPVAGTLSATSTSKAPGDAAAWIRWWAGQYNLRGKKIWLRKYFHDVNMPVAGGDTINSTQRTAYGTFAALVMGGLTITGYSSRSICDKNGHGAVAYNVPTYITTRTLKRRSNSPL